jgi:murein DD-endopeptidase MepM/ murein hydrolase activator NlpD
MKQFRVYKKHYRVIASALFAGLILTLPAAVFGQTAAELQNKINQSNSNISALEKEIAGYQSQLDGLEKQKSSLSTELAQIELNRKKLAASISVTQNKIDATNAKIQELSSQIGNKEQDISNDIESIKEGFRQINESDNSSMLATLLSESNFTDAWNDIDAIETLRESTETKISELRQNKTDLEGTRDQTTAAKDQLVALKSQLSDQKKIVDQNAADKSKLLSQTKNSEANYQALLADREAKKTAFEKELEDYESQLKYVLNPASLPAPGSLSWPLESVYVTNPFGKNSSGLYVTGMHNGVDFRASVGTPVMAMADGVVAGTGDTDLQCAGVSFGRFILIKYNDGLASTFGHLSLIKIHTGESVKRGEVVGYSGATGYVTGPHLHVSVYPRDAVNVQTLPSKSCPGKNLTQPISPINAYLDPMIYLPPYHGVTINQNMD